MAKIYLQAEQVDLCSLPSVQKLAKKLLHALPKLDTVILNAGHGAFSGINWPLAILTALNNFPHSVTYPRFKLSKVGEVTGPQIPSASGLGKTQQPALGTVFCSNVFGHYVLVHGIAPLLSNSVGTPGRIVWIGSLEAYPSVFSTSDMQGLSSPSAYESSKRLTDILALSSSLPSTQTFVRQFLPPPRDHRPPKQYVTHPGICATNILPLHWILAYIMTAAFYLARWVGSPWHTVTSYKGACAPVWVALASQEDLDALEKDKGAGKWGSSINVWGEERATRTEVHGWGIGGKVGDNISQPPRWQPREVADLTEQDRERFEELSRACWQSMERLRVEWEGLLGEDD